MVMTEKDLVLIRRLSAEIADATHQRTKAVRRLREKGATWTEVGYALGCTAQAAQQRYGNGDERSEAHKERAARRAVKRIQKAAASEPKSKP